MNEQLNTKEVEKKKMQEYKSRIINQHDPVEIQKMAQHAIFELKKEIRKINNPPDISAFYGKLVDLLKKDPISGLACMDRIGEFVFSEIKTSNE